MLTVESWRSGKAVTLSPMRSWIQVLETASCRNAVKAVDPSWDPVQARATCTLLPFYATMLSIASGPYTSLYLQCDMSM
jgi:hypothetical protein